MIILKEFFERYNGQSVERKATKARLDKDGNYVFKVKWIIKPRQNEKT